MEMAQRGAWEIHVFFIAWALTLLHALVRPAKQAWIEQLWCAAALLALLPLLSALLTERPLWQSIAKGDWIFAGLELSLWALALLHAALATRTAHHQAKVKVPRPARSAVSSPASGTLGKEGA
jgi:hypothetical protein